MIPSLFLPEKIVHFETHGLFWRKEARLTEGGTPVGSVDVPLHWAGRSQFQSPCPQHSDRAAPGTAGTSISV